jgi:acyl-CoA dehydrogenase
MSYYDLNPNLTDEDLSLKKAAHEFAAEVMRPISRELDAMTAEEAIAEGSPFWEFMRLAYEQGYHSVLLPAEVGGGGLSPLQLHIVNEELAWGSFGLAVQLCVSAIPFCMAVRAGNEELIEKYVKPYCECKDGSIRGCLANTEPDHGTNLTRVGEEFYRNPQFRRNVQARLEGNEWVLKGQKSAWISGGSIATHAFISGGVDPSEGLKGGSFFFCPLDLDGVTCGKPLEKVGQRDLNQGEIYLDDVRIPENYLLVDVDALIPTQAVFGAYAYSNMGSLATGLARAAFEEALEYAKIRVQGGKPIIEHASIKQRLFRMFSKIETSRAISRLAMQATSNFYDTELMTIPLIEYGAISKVTCTRAAYEVADEAVQILGSNGLAREYITEKLFRDARATLIEDGMNEMLEWTGGGIMSLTYPRQQ